MLLFHGVVVPVKEVVQQALLLAVEAAVWLTASAAGEALGDPPQA